MNQVHPNTLRAGCSAFLDTFSGLVPCRVRKVTSTFDPLLAKPRLEAEVKVTRTIKAYRKDDLLTFDAQRVVPLGALTHRDYSTAILPYNIEVTP